ncbi:MAG: DUF1641 domain-containing protein [Bacteroidetes bacterium]|nr:DUF1641 domain-containing protein [Bacteroidota bacterium]
METNGNATDLLASEAGQQVRARLSEERTLMALDKLLQRIDTLETAVERLSTIMDQAPGMAAMVTDMADERINQASQQGINLEERLGNALHLAEKLTAPEMTKKLDKLVEFAEQGPGLMSMVVDVVDEGMRNAIDNGYDPQALLHLAGTANTALVQAVNTPPAKVGGIFGLLKAIKDPDRQRGLGFLMNFLKEWGKRL